jgi:predicted hotdog family 3-hydroxylacyl-ACP dehydratase
VVDRFLARSKISVVINRQDAHWPHRQDACATTVNVPRDKPEIRTLIPHAGTMCLLDSVHDWNDDWIVCHTNTHRDPTNPLRRDGRLSALHALEYGAQAAAVHGGLRARAAGATAPPCYLAALRDARLHVDRLDDLASPLEVRAQRLFGEAGNTIYQCAILAGGTAIAEGRVTIMLRA